MQFYGPSGKRYTMSDVIGKGGEATVYQVAGQSRWAAKIYSKKTPDRLHKLEWMITYPPDDPTKKRNHTSIAWPIEVLYSGKTIAGYLMPFIHDAVPVLNVFNPRLRHQTFRGFTLLHLLNTAHNIAAALGAVHQRGYVVGDLNESNVLVSRNTLVTLIDTDSFQVRTKTENGRFRTHLCKVGKPEYLPPEMQKRDLKTTVRIPEHDRFALAVLIWQLLMDGNHPFRSRWISSSEKLSLPERIEAGLFPFREQAKPIVSPRADIQLLHPDLQDLFLRCFSDGHTTPSSRPAPAEWERALTEAIQNGKECRRGHFYSKHLRQCPECEREPIPIHRAVPVKNVAKSRPIQETPSQQQPRPQKITPPALTARFQPHFALPGMPAQIQSKLPQLRKYYDRFRRWLGNRKVNAYFLQPAVWGIAGFILGGLFSTSLSGPGIGRISGVIGGVVSGALAGSWVEKKVGWGAFFTGFGFLAGIFFWYSLGGESSQVAWYAAGIGGGIAGWLLGLYGRIVDLTVLWAVSGAIAGLYLGQMIANLVGIDWIGGALSSGLLSMLSGVAYAIWRRS